MATGEDEVLRSDAAAVLATVETTSIDVGRGVEQQELRPLGDAAEADRDAEDEEDEDERPLTPEEQREQMIFYAEQVLRLMAPIAITFVLTVWWVDAIYGGRQVYYGGVILYREEEGDSFWNVLGGSLANSLIILGAVLCSTCLFVLLFYYNCMVIIYAWLGISTGMVLGGIGGIVIYQLLAHYNVAVDWLTLIFVLFNFAGVGLVAIFGQSPLYITQMFLIAVSAFMATNLVALPQWTAWTLLAIIAIYDIFAVLCSRGPLKVLVNTAQARNQQIPGLLYSAGMARQARYAPGGVYVTVDAEDDEDLAELSAAARQQQGHAADEAQEAPPVQGADGDGGALGENSEEEDDKSRHPIQLGLGDFIFYSVLVGRAALTDWVTAVACAFVTIIGLCLTLFLLALQRRPLPALPISIGLGILFYFASSACMSPYFAALLAAGVHV